jgi:hypothetical protein
MPLFAAWFCSLCVALSVHAQEAGPPKPVYVEKGLKRIDALLEGEGLIVAVGSNGLAKRDQHGDWTFKAWAPAVGSGRVVPVDLKQDGTTEFVRFSSNRNRGVSVVDAFSAGGELLWSYQPKFPEQDNVAGLLLAAVPGRTRDGKQVVRIIAGHNSKVLLLDAEGRFAGFEEWARPNQCTIVTVPEAGGEAVLFGSDGRLELRGPDGARRFERDFTTAAVRAYVSRVDRLAPSDAGPRANVFVSARKMNTRIPMDQDYEVVTPLAGTVSVRPWTDAEYVGIPAGPEVNGVRLCYSFTGRNTLCVNGFDAQRRLVAQVPLAPVGEYSIEQSPDDRAMVVTAGPDGRKSIMVAGGYAVWCLDETQVKAGPVTALDPPPK